MDFRVLGPLAVEAEGRDRTPRRPRERAVLAVLLLRSPSVVGLDDLLEGVWGETAPPTARTATHGLVSSLRRTLGAERIETRAPGYRLRLLPGDRYDVTRFQELVEEAAGAEPSIRTELLREALDLFRGVPFGDLDLAIDLHAEVARLEGLRLAAEEARIDAELELGREREVIPRLHALVAEHPLRETLRAQLIVALYRAGRQSDALRVAQDARTILATELGVEPGPVLQRLERQVLAQDPELLQAGAGAGAAATPSAAEVLAGGFATLLAVLPARDGRLDLDLVRELTASHGAAQIETRRRRGPVAAFAFARAREAAAAAAAIQRAVGRAGGAVRIGLHSAGTGPLSPAPAAELAMRLAEVAHPGQVVLSRGTRDLLREVPLRELDVHDLGDHRLADLGPRQPLFQLVAPGLPADLPPTRGLDDLPTNLPIQATPLVDREAELEAVTSLLCDPDMRLVTLTGPGGTGKTRLALHAAAELLGDLDGAWFVPLDALADAALVPSTVAATLRVAGEGDGALAALARELDGRRVLVLLDNFEHVLDAAEFVGGLLERTSGPTVLVTSRVPLKLDGERVVPVPPLPVPAAPGRPAATPGRPAATRPRDATADAGAEAEADVAGLLAVGSVELFTARARAVRPEFTLTPRDAGAVAALCRALDGLPLAIELAASRIGLMSPATLLERLDRSLRVLATRDADTSARHRALDAAIDWSHELLDPDARQLFAATAVFAGGWTLDAAEAVCGDGTDVVDGLAGLVDHSLVRLDGSEADPRFGMLETIRDYAASRLEASGRRPELERRHASFFLSLAETAEPHLRGNPGPWLVRIGAEDANLRAALDRLAHGAGGEADAAATEAKLAGALWRYWYLAGHLDEGRARLEHALAVHREPTAARVKVLIGAAVMAVNSGDPPAATQRAAEAVELARASGDAWSAAYARFMLANAARNAGDDGTARPLFDVAMRSLRELGDEHSALLAARSLAAALLDAGERGDARELYQDSLRRARAAGNGRIEASTLGALATIAYDEGRLTDAMLLLRESLRIHRELGDRLDSAVDLGRAALILAMGGHPEESARLLGLLAAVRAELGLRGRAVATLAEATRAGLRRQLAAGELERLVAEGARLRFDAALELALDALT